MKNLKDIKSVLNRTRHSVLNARRFLSFLPKNVLEKLVKQTNKGNSGYIGRYKYLNFVDIPTGKRIILGESDYIYNLITDDGRALFLNRIGANSLNFINAMAIGTGTTAPELDDEALETETIRKNVTVTNHGSPDWKAVFNAVFNSSEVNGTTEIGLLNSQSVGGVLATRNVHDAISVPEGSAIAFDYEILLQSGEKSTGYTLTAGKTKTFEKAVPVDVRFVVELETGNGYSKQTSVNAVESTTGSYYYDSLNSKLYLHTTDDADPDSHEIVVYSGG
jgi:hypothetical protein